MMSLDIPLGEVAAPATAEPVRIAARTVYLSGGDGRPQERDVSFWCSQDGTYLIVSFEPVETFWSGNDCGRAAGRWEALTGQRIEVADVMRANLGGAS